METIDSPKYKCKKCNYSTINRYDYKKHCTTLKHKKKSNVISHTEDNDFSEKELIITLVKQNAELICQNNELVDMIKNGNNSIINSNNTNCNNKTFNLNVFLNDTCKDAMNITDFVDSVKLQLSDLEKFGEIGYVEGISNIITSNLKALDVTLRPVHCTDKKRETIYIKNDDKWEKEDDNKTKLRLAIKKIANKNIRLLPKFREKYPDYNDSRSRTSDIYDKMVVEAMGGCNGDNNEKEDRIIRNITKCTTIEKYI
jgi:hypothetical protein